MAELITLSVKTVGAAEALTQLKTLQTAARGLSSSPITIKVSAEGVNRNTVSVINTLVRETSRLATENLRAQAATAKFTAQQTRATASLRRAANEEARLARGLGAVSDGYRQVGAAAEKSGDSIMSAYKKMLLWSAAGTLIYGPIHAFKDAIETLKAADDELVVVGKVSDASAAELANLEKQAYATASAYGVAADQYLSSVSEFTRAGYDGAASGLAELAVKTQLVGDVTQDVANQYLLSVDAAYKYGGEISKLSAVLDGANEIDNNYATSIQKLAEGLGTVAPIAAQAHVGVDELTAAIGTITAVTQRSGTEAARAFRALVLNILGDTKTEIDEGVTWTTGEIAGLRDVIKMYATDAYEAATATGEVINPMEAIAGLADSFEKGILTEQKLMEMVSDIGGKLRSSQLLALVQNFDMYESMLADFATAAGSADKEVENAMDSWTRKIEILRNTWTEFVSTLVSRDAVKGGLDALINLLKFVNTDAGAAVVTIAALTAGVAGLGKAAGALSKTDVAQFIKDLAALKSGAQTVVTSQLAMTAATGGLGAAIKALTAAMMANPLFWVAAGGAAIFGIVKIVDQITTNFEEQKEIVAKTAAEVDTLKSEYDALLSKSEALTAEEERRLKILQAEIEAKKAEYEAEKALEFEKFNEERGTGAGATYNSGGAPRAATADVAQLYNFIYALEEAEDQYTNAETTAEEYRKAQQALLVDTKDYVDILRDYKEAGMELSLAQEEIITRYDELAASLNTTADAEAIAAEGAEEISNELSGISAKVAEAKAALEDFNTAMEGGEKGDAFKEYSAIYAGFLEKFGAGLFGSNEYRNAIELFLPENILRGLEYDYQAAGEMLASEFWQGVFAENGEDYGANFINALNEMADEQGNLVDGNGRLVASFEELDGAVEFDLESLELLAEYLGTTPELIAAIVGATDIFKGEMQYTAEEALSVVKELGGAFGELNGQILNIDVSSFVDRLIDAGYAGQEIFALVDALKGIDDVSLTNVPQDLGQLITDLELAKGKADTTKEGLDEIGETKPEIKIEANTSAVKAAESYVKLVKARIENGAATFTIRTVLTGAKIPAMADGTDNAKGGPTLVNEEGAELIAEGNKAYIAGGGKPTIVDLEPGAQVFPADETKSILNGRTLSGVIPARKYSGAVPKTQGAGGASSSSGAAKRPSSSSAKASVDVGVNAESARDELDALLQDMEHQIFLWEKQGNMSDAIVTQYRNMQKEVHGLAEKFRQQGLDETADEIQDLQKLWWDYEEEIEKVYEEIADAQQALWDELEDAVDKKLEEAAEARDKELNAIDAEIERLRDVAEEEDKLLALEEKRQAVLEAQDNLLKAQQERTVRIFNAKENQWEWVARPQDVESAQKALEEAQKEYAEYEKELALEAEIEALEARKEAIQSAYDAFEEEWERIKDSILEPGRDISEILRDIAQNGAPAMQQAVSSVANLLGGLGNYKQAAVGASTGGSYAGGGGVASKDYSTDTTDYSSLMLNSKSYDEFKYWEGQRNNKIEAQGIDLGESGYRDNEKLYNEWKDKQTYDSGGVLHGLGGIKATSRDEVVLPPSVTEAMLSPTSNATFKRRVAELGYLFGSTDASALRREGLTTTNNNSVTNNGGPYYFNGIEIGRREAETLTISQLAQQMKVLALHTAR